MNYHMVNQRLQLQGQFIPAINYSQDQNLYQCYLRHPDIPSNGWVYNSYQQSQFCPQSANFVVPQNETKIKNNLQSELSDLKLNLKNVQKAKSDQEIQMNSVLEESQKLFQENKELRAEKTELEDSLKTAKEAHIEEINKLKQQLTKLENKLEDRSTQVAALNEVSEMLLQGIEKRDKLITEYKKRQQGSFSLKAKRVSLIETISSTLANDCSRSSTPSMKFGASTGRRIGQKALHALITLGAENTSGPWLCSLCGTGEIPLNIPTYPEFRQHLINVHKKIIDPALCEHCGWRSSTDRELHLHMYKEHQIESLFYRFSKDALLKKRDYD